MVNIISDGSSLAPDFDNNLFAMNQLVLYTKGNIIDISTEGKGIQPLYKINLKGGQGLHVGTPYLFHPSNDTMNEAS